MARYKKGERDRLMAEARQRLLDAALAEFAQQGYAGANVNRISLAAGFGQGTVYNYFPSKRALFAAVVEEIVQRQGELILQGVASAAGPAARLERLLTAGFAFAQGFPTAAQVILAAVYGSDPEARELAYPAYERLLRYVEREIVLTGMQEGVFRQVEARLASDVIMAVYLGGCVAHGGPLRTNPRAAAAILIDGLRGEH